MSFRIRSLSTLVVSGLLVAPIGQSAEHPGLIMTQSGVERMRAELGNVPMFDATLRKVKKQVDAEIRLGIETPIPRDFSGGYTDERHKRNYFTLQKAGVLFQLLQDEKYAIYIRDMLLQYAAIYRDLPRHPLDRSYARGKLFWQCLNDANWLVYVSQAYDSIHDWLSAEERDLLEERLFHPFADFLSIDNPECFNRINNHSAWATAAVGMTGLVMGDDGLVERALYGIAGRSPATAAKDDAGNLIERETQQAGFLANLESSFSPDGYYTEGPYYQRYAMYPFLVFSQALRNSKPELEIFDYKGGVLLKAVHALLYLSDADGEFFPLNDAQKGMSYHARDVVAAVDIAYHVGGDAGLLSIAVEQDEVLLDEAGFSVASAVRDGKVKPFRKKSVNLSDGRDGNEGGVAVLRSGNNELVFKYSAQGLTHGHYDKLSFSYYEHGDEVLQDYGVVRFVNIGAKGGGSYLEENETWAKQTIAHNTVTINESSHFRGDYAIGSRHHSELHFFDTAGSELQVASATEDDAYPGTRMRRTMALVRKKGARAPFLLDIFKVTSGKSNQYDLPFYFKGQLIDANFDFETPGVLRKLGSKNGYQHLYVEGRGRPSTDNAQLTWLSNGEFYSLTATAESADKLLFTRLGANDPDFNLRRDAAFMIRRPNSRNTVFASLVESLGSYDPVKELSLDSATNIAGLSIAHDDANYTAVWIETRSGTRTLFIVAAEASASARHELEIAGRAYRWSGPWHHADVK